MNEKVEMSRVTRSKQEAQKMYDRISRWYDLLGGNQEARARAVGLDKLRVATGETVLEIGFGTGHSIVKMARAVGESGKVYGVDLSPRMIEITQNRVSENELSKRVELRQGDAARLPFEAETFDAVFMSFTLELFDTPEIPIVLGACRRVLRRGGRICVISLSKAGEDNWMRKLYEWGHERLPRFLDCRPIFVREALEETEFEIASVTEMFLWGLLVEIVLAK